MGADSTKSSGKKGWTRRIEASSRGGKMRRENPVTSGQCGIRYRAHLMEVANAPSVIPAPPAKQPLISRLFWFGVGGGFSVLLNIGPFHWLRTHAGLSDGAALAISLT